MHCNQTLILMRLPLSQERLNIKNFVSLYFCFGFFFKYMSFQISWEMNWLEAPPSGQLQTCTVLAFYGTPCSFHHLFHHLSSRSPPPIIFSVYALFSPPLRRATEGVTGVCCESLWWWWEHGMWHDFYSVWLLLIFEMLWMEMWSEG